MFSMISARLYISVRTVESHVSSLLRKLGAADRRELAAMAEPRRRRAIAAWLVSEGVEVTRRAVGDVGKLCTHWHGQGPVAVRSARQVGQRLEVARIGGKLALLSGH